MAYSDHFVLTDDLIKHLDLQFAGLRDPFIESRYTGFLAVSSVTVLELALKDIFCEFAQTKHKVLGNFCLNYFKRINGRIALGEIRGDYIPKFGDKYLARFDKRLSKLEKDVWTNHRTSVKTSYNNILTWRHQFTHTGTFVVSPTYAEVKQGYFCGKQVMDCLALCMHR